MRYLMLFCLAALLFVACANFEKKDLYGSWASPEMSFTFNEDTSFKMDMGLNKLEGKFKTFGNTVELIDNTSGKVVFTMLIKSLKDGELTINIPSMGADRLYTMKKINKKKFAFFTKVTYLCRRLKIRLHSSAG